MSSAAERVWVSIVEIATPATPHLKAMTNKRLRITLSMPEMMRKMSGRLVSPTARRTALPKLYMVIDAMPRKYIRR